MVSHIFDKHKNFFGNINRLVTQNLKFLAPRPRVSLRLGGKVGLCQKSQRIKKLF